MVHKQSMGGGILSGNYEVSTEVIHSTDFFMAKLSGLLHTVDVWASTCMTTVHPTFRQPFYALFCWLSGKASASRAADLGSIPAFAVDLFPVRVIPVTSELVFQWILCHVPKRVSTGTGWPGVSIL